MEGQTYEQKITCNMNLRGCVLVLEIVFVGQCEVFVCHEQGVNSIKKLSTFPIPNPLISNEFYSPTVLFFIIIICKIYFNASQKLYFLKLLKTGIKIA